MSSVLLELLAGASGQKPYEVASALGIPADSSDTEAAQAILALPERVEKVKLLLEGGLPEPEPAGAVSADVAHALGLEPGCSELAAVEAIEQLGGFMALNTLAIELGLEAPSTQTDCVHAIEGLQEQTRDKAGEKLVQRCLDDGIIKDGQADFWRSRARQDLRGTEQALNSLRFTKRRGR